MKTAIIAAFGVAVGTIVVAKRKVENEPLVGSDVKPYLQVNNIGPASVCDSDRYNLFREDRRDLICSNKNRGPNTVPATLFSLLRNQTKKLVFYHIPKTGGEALEQAFGIEKNHNPWTTRNKGDDIENIIAFTVIRNPFDRMLSWFRFCLHGYYGHLPDPVRFCLLAHQLIDEASDEHGNHTTKSVSNAFESWLEQSYLVLLDNPWLTSNYHQFLGGTSPLHVDYIIRFEHYSEDYALLAEAIDIEKKLVKKNSSTNSSGAIDPNFPQNMEHKVKYNPQVAELLKTSYKELYTKRARELVEMKYELDLRFFNYTF